MKSVISTRDIEELLRTGGGVQSLPDDAILTPSARDLLRDLESAAPRAPNGAAARTAPPPPLLSTPAAPVSAAAAPKPAPSPPAPGQSPNSQSPKPEIEAFFHSSYCHELKLQICDIGRRLWKRAYVDGNGGNIAIRVGDDLVLCTPTLVSKGFMKPEDMCLVDFEGNQVLGAKKRTSEILMHLQMMRAQPMDIASVHCHPPYATAFAVAGVLPPTCMIPEYEVFASVAIAPYRTPGTPEMGKLVAELVGQHNTILMANHGVVTWSHNNVEEAYWRMEIIEAYCRTLTVAAQLGQPMKTFSPEQMKDLLAIKKNLGFVDPRYGLKECELCDNAEWRPGVTCAVPSKHAAAASHDPAAEQIVQAITDQIMARVQ